MMLGGAVNDINTKKIENRLPAKAYTPPPAVISKRYMT
jgi:hypothetical protein